ncbi:MAG TPA: squalene--hopene cyclase [Caulobacteraceae bacterium]|jgi:squalene-hopene/tetraprenyl-beta-curcumene cyclase|nr:squalene--hopene cyclase [Caulobacteraceae bacterium]
MDDAAEILIRAPAQTLLDDAVSRAGQALLSRQKSDGHWVFELEADATIPAEYVLLRAYLGEPDAPELESKIGVYLRRIQADHGGWGLFHGGKLDVSCTVKAYFALKMIGDSPDAAHMKRAREALLAHGGAGACNVFTRIMLALFGVISWRATPEIPVEIIHLPSWFPIHLAKISYWARTVIVPLLVLRALEPRARNPRGVTIDELFVAPPSQLKGLPRGAHQKEPWASCFFALDAVLRVVRPMFPKASHAAAIAKAKAFVDERLNGEDGLGAIFPAMANAVMMYDALGYPEDDPNRATARGSIEKLLVVHEDEAYCQPCLSPVWDTALAAHALLEAGGEACEAAVGRSIDWLKPLQVLDLAGDWAQQRPGVRPGGWAFQYRNDHYPDLDDTAVVVMAMDRARGLAHAQGGEVEAAIGRGREWVEGLQSANGGWGAFDADNTYHYLNNIPFADHGALLDPPTEDVTGRCVSMLAQLGEPIDSPRMKTALAYLEKVQLGDGSWFGRWGVNYIYGTWSVLCALNAAGLPGEHPMLARAADWLIAIQNEDGGWGEDCESYRLDYRGYEPAGSIASQTAWALMGLMAAGRTEHPAVARGIAWLLQHQTGEGIWDEPWYTGGGFPRVFYLRYHGYSKIFPLWALARYRNLTRANSGKVAWGM